MKEQKNKAHKEMLVRFSKKMAIKNSTDRTYSVAEHDGYGNYIHAIVVPYGHSG